MIDQPIGVFCVPGCAYSAAYCQQCINADAHPWSILVCNTACVGALDQMADWWRDLVQSTCQHLGKTIEEFNEDVKRLDEQMQKDLQDYTPQITGNEFEGL